MPITPLDYRSPLVLVVFRVEPDLSPLLQNAIEVVLTE